jgi:hypothetical protein
MFSSKDKAEPLTVLITGAAGQIGYALAPQICRGAMFGPGRKVILHLLDIAPAATALEGVVMELIDAAFPLLAGALHSYEKFLLRIPVGFPRQPTGLQCHCGSVVGSLLRSYPFGRVRNASSSSLKNFTSLENRR